MGLRTHSGTFLCQIWLFWLQHFLRHCGKTDRQTDAQTNSAETLRLVTTIGVGNKKRQLSQRDPRDDMIVGIKI